MDRSACDVRWAGSGDEQNVGRGLVGLYIYGKNIPKPAVSYIILMVWN